MITIAINSPNTDRSLLTIEEARVAIGLDSADTSKDATLTPLNAYVAAMITSACKVAKSGIIPPTLRLETVVETFLFTSLQKSLVLARSPLVDVVSVTQTESLLDTTDYAIDYAAGILYRTQFGFVTTPNGPYGWWPYGNTVVEYSAGYATVPDDLKYAATKFIRAEYVTGTRDPNLRSLTIEGVSSRTWWVPDKQTNAGIVPGEVMDILRQGGYVKAVFA